MGLNLFTDGGLRRLSLSFNLYETNPEELTWTELGEAKDYAMHRESVWLGRAWDVANYLETDLPQIRGATVENIKRWESAYDKWVLGNAEPYDMPDVLHFCIVQANAWEAELETIDSLIKAKLRAS